ncbi:snRNA-activating protein complex subunit 4 [Anaeramoeba flamelloides]|uniref:snRNA-activating protein complex subunit 4 n=1 Tax=Anaeramoeba flamelloides TaxID=1746091 RepID=A0ABQ8ZA45_9EUKA|nr:snRNA-activating protein complex subunit 4 [Anaeramoeba flamelloides]
MNSYTTFWLDRILGKEEKKNSKDLSTKLCVALNKLFPNTIDEISKDPLINGNKFLMSCISLGFQIPTDINPSDLTDQQNKNSSLEQLLFDLSPQHIWEKSFKCPFKETTSKKLIYELIEQFALGKSHFKVEIRDLSQEFINGDLYLNRDYLTICSNLLNTEKKIDYYKLCPNCVFYDRSNTNIISLCLLNNKNKGNSNSNLNNSQVNEQENDKTKEKENENECSSIILKFQDVKQAFQFEKLIKLFKTYFGNSLENYPILGNILTFKKEMKAITLRLLYQEETNFNIKFLEITQTTNKKKETISGLIKLNSRNLIILKFNKLQKEQYQFNWNEVSLELKRIPNEKDFKKLLIIINFKKESIKFLIKPINFQNIFLIENVILRFLKKNSSNNKKFGINNQSMNKNNLFHPFTLDLDQNQYQIKESSKETEQKAINNNNKIFIREFDSEGNPALIQLNFNNIISQIENSRLLYLSNPSVSRLLNQLNEKILNKKRIDFSVYATLLENQRQVNNNTNPRTINNNNSTIINNNNFLRCRITFLKNIDLIVLTLENGIQLKINYSSSQLIIHPDYDCALLFKPLNKHLDDKEDNAKKLKCPIIIFTKSFLDRELIISCFYLHSLNLTKKELGNISKKKEILFQISKICCQLKKSSRSSRTQRKFFFNYSKKTISFNNITNLIRTNLYLKNALIINKNNFINNDVDLMKNNTNIQYNIGIIDSFNNLIQGDNIIELSMDRIILNNFNKTVFSVYYTLYTMGFALKNSILKLHLNEEKFIKFKLKNKRQVQIFLKDLLNKKFNILKNKNHNLKDEIKKDENFILEKFENIFINGFNEEMQFNLLLSTEGLLIQYQNNTILTIPITNYFNIIENNQYIYIILKKIIVLQINLLNKQNMKRFTAVFNNIKRDNFERNNFKLMRITPIFINKMYSLVYRFNTFLGLCSFKFINNFQLELFLPNHHSNNHHHINDNNNKNKTQIINLIKSQIIIHPTKNTIIKLQLIDGNYLFFSFVNKKQCSLFMTTFIKFQNDHDLLKISNNNNSDDDNDDDQDKQKNIDNQKKIKNETRNKYKIILIAQLKQPKLKLGKAKIILNQDRIIIRIIKKNEKNREKKRLYKQLYSKLLIDNSLKNKKFIRISGFSGKHFTLFLQFSNLKHSQDFYNKFITFQQKNNFNSFNNNNSDNNNDDDVSNNSYKNFPKIKIKYVPIKLKNLRPLNCYQLLQITNKNKELLYNCSIKQINALNGKKNKKNVLKKTDSYLNSSIYNDDNAFQNSLIFFELNKLIISSQLMFFSISYLKIRNFQNIKNNYNIIIQFLQQKKNISIEIQFATFFEKNSFLNDFNNFIKIKKKEIVTINDQKSFRNFNFNSLTIDDFQKFDSDLNSENCDNNLSVSSFGFDSETSSVSGSESFNNLKSIYNENIINIKKEIKYQKSENENENKEENENENENGKKFEKGKEREKGKQKGNVDRYYYKITYLNKKNHEIGKGFLKFNNNGTISLKAYNQNDIIVFENILELKIYSKEKNHNEMKLISNEYSYIFHIDTNQSNQTMIEEFYIYRKLYKNKIKKLFKNTKPKKAHKKVYNIVLFKEDQISYKRSIQGNLQIQTNPDLLIFKLFGVNQDEDGDEKNARTIKREITGDWVVFGNRNDQTNIKIQTHTNIEYIVKMDTVDDSIQFTSQIENLISPPPKYNVYITLPWNKENQLAQIILEPEGLNIQTNDDEFNQILPLNEIRVRSNPNNKFITKFIFSQISIKIEFNDLKEKDDLLSLIIEQKKANQLRKKFKNVSKKSRNGNKVSRSGSSSDSGSGSSSGSDRDSDSGSSSGSGSGSDYGSSSKSGSGSGSGSGSVSGSGSGSSSETASDTVSKLKNKIDPNHNLSGSNKKTETESKLELNSNQEQFQRLSLWKTDEDQKLKKMVKHYKKKDWEKIANKFENYNSKDCLLRYRKIMHLKIQKGPWNSVEDEFLIKAVNTLGLSAWYQIAELVPSRNVKQCRERWKNQLDPDINRGEFTEEEKKLLKQKVYEIGTRWCIVSTFFKGRPENMLKNYWYSIVMQSSKKKKRQKNKSPKQASSCSKLRDTKKEKQTENFKNNSLQSPTNRPHNLRKRTYSSSHQLTSNTQISNKLPKKNNKTQKRTNNLISHTQTNIKQDKTHVITSNMDSKENKSNIQEANKNNICLENTNNQQFSELKLISLNSPQRLGNLENKQNNNRKLNQKKIEEINDQNENLFTDLNLTMPNNFEDISFESFENSSFSKNLADNNQEIFLDQVPYYDEAIIDLNNLWPNIMESDVSVSDFDLWVLNHRSENLNNIIQFF